jgi:hypothetical protein
VTTISTINLDAAHFDKPLVNFLYGAKYRDNVDVTERLYDSNHMQWVLETGALKLAHSSEELFDVINGYLEGFDTEKEGRRELLKKLCYKTDGRSSERMVAAIDAVYSGSQQT